VEELSKALYLLMPFLSYLPRTEALKKIAKLNNLYDGIIENKRQSMNLGELNEKLNNNSADLLEYMIQACNDPENPTLTNEELRVRIKILNIIFTLINQTITFSNRYSIMLQFLCWLVTILVRKINACIYCLFIIIY
jgi:hypothetical protein